MADTGPGVGAIAHQVAGGECCAVGILALVDGVADLVVIDTEEILLDRARDEDDRGDGTWHWPCRPEPAATVRRRIAVLDDGAPYK